MCQPCVAWRGRLGSGSRGSEALPEAAELPGPAQEGCQAAPQPRDTALRSHLLLLLPPFLACTSSENNSTLGHPDSVWPVALSIPDLGEGRAPLCAL